MDDATRAWGRRVAEAMRDECIRHCTEIGERATMRSIRIDAIIASVPFEDEAIDDINARERERKQGGGA